MDRKRTVLVTGGTRGIGRAIAETFSDNGYNVVIVYKESQEIAKKLVSEMNAKERAFQAIQADVSNPADVERIKKEAAFGFFDTVINNAGVAHINLMRDDTLEDYERVMGTDFKGAWLVTKAFLPDMYANNFGRIINISSFWAQHGSCGETLYCAAKAALNGLTRALSRETGDNITVNSISAGLICTDMNDIASPESLVKIVDESAARRIGRPDDIARVALFLADEKSDFITGAVIPVDGGY